jgi:hypothetical protein
MGLRVDRPLTAELNMKGILGVLVLALLVAPAGAALAQQGAEPRPDGVRAEIEEIVERSGLRTAVDSLATASTPELERALGHFAATLEVLALRIAEDAELRASAVRAGEGLAEVAQVVVVEQSTALQAALRELADRLGTLSRAPAEPH